MKKIQLIEKSIELTEQESKVYDKIIKSGTMEDMFKLGYVVGRGTLAQEMLDELTVV